MIVLRQLLLILAQLKRAFLHYYDLGLQFKCLLEFLSIKGNFNYLSQIFYHSLEEFTINWSLTE